MPSPLFDDIHGLLQSVNDTESLRVTHENYHSIEANRVYMSASQFSDWLDCPARTFAKLFLGYEEEEKTHFLGGRYAHCSILEPELLDEFEKENPTVRNSGQWKTNELKEFAADKGIDLKGAMKSKETIVDRMAEHGYTPPKAFASEYKWIDTTLPAFRKQPFMPVIERGLHEVIITFPLGQFGMKPVYWKAMLDSVRQEDQQFGDCKFMKDFEGAWAKEDGKNRKFEWYEAPSDYERQMAIYQQGTLHKYGAPFLPNIYAGTKQDPPDFDWLQFRDQDGLDEQIEHVIEKLPTIMEYKTGEQEPLRCDKGSCKYCRSTKVIKFPRVPQRTRGRG